MLMQSVRKAGKLDNVSATSNCIVVYACYNVNDPYISFMAKIFVSSNCNNFVYLGETCFGFSKNRTILGGLLFAQSLILQQAAVEGFSRVLPGFNTA